MKLFRNKSAITKMQSAAIIVIVVVAIIAVAAYYFIFPPGPERVTINVLTVSGARFETPLRALLPSFNEKYPWIDVKITAIGMGELLAEKGPLELSSRRGAYDIVCIDAIYTTVYAEAGWTLDVHDWIMGDDPELNIPDFEIDLPWNIRYYTMQDIEKGSPKYGRYFAITTDNNCYLVFFRKSAFKEVGIGYDDIKTYPQCLEVFEKLRTAGYETPIEMSLKQPIWSAANFMGMLWAAGGQVWNEDTYLPELNTIYARAALEQLKDEFQYCIPGCLTYSDPEIIETWLREEAIYMPHEWGNPVYTDPEYSTFADDTDCTQLVPTWPEGYRYPECGKTKASRVTKLGCAPVMGGLPYAIDSASKHPKEAYLLLRWLTIKENAKAYVDNTGQPGRMSVLGNSDIQKEHPYFEGLYANMPNAVYRGGVAIYMELDTIISREVQRYLIGEITIEECMDLMQKECYEAFEAAGYYKTVSYEERVQNQIQYILGKANEYQELRLRGLVDPDIPPWTVI